MSGELTFVEVKSVVGYSGVEFLPVKGFADCVLILA
jgi:hypothetical protein